MARSKGSLSSEQAKEISGEMEKLCGTQYKQNFDYLRMIEMLLCQRILEQVSEFNEDDDIYTKVTSVEIPLIGDIEIHPRVFHESHGVTNRPSIHFDFEFKPSNVFKADVLSAYTKKESPIPEYFSNLYGEELKDIYSRMRRE